MAPSRPKRALRLEKKPVNFQFTEGVDGSVKLDLCSVIKCKSQEKDHTRSQVYVCTSSTCSQRKNRLCGAATHTDPDECCSNVCSTWSQVIVNTGTDRGYSVSHPLKNRLTTFKTTPPYPRKTDVGRYVLGAWERGADPLGFFMITANSQAPPTLPPNTVTAECMMRLHMTTNPANCSTLNRLFPVVANDTIPPVFSPKEGQYVCLTREGTAPIRSITHSWCNTTSNVASKAEMSNLVVARADLFWYCGGKVLRNILPPDWSGTCALVRLAFPITLMGHKYAPLGNHSIHRTKRSSPGDFDLTTNSPTYFDAIGIPRGVPDEYKLADPIANGFESVLFWITPNKNIDRINYVHYNVQKLANLTRDTMAGLSEQLAMTSLMTVQNRMALDMLLAEKGGVCIMIDGSCCTFIPNNTAPDGSVTKALEGLRTLFDQMTKDSGVDNPFHDWMTKVFGKLQGLIMSVLVSIAIFAGIVTCCGCCAIPCLRTLINKLITTALTKEETPPPYQMPLLADIDYDHLDAPGEMEESEIDCV
uniref:Uncharacterized protein n=1 Tax=Mola mola TaxID=94237 RepID=A0A3Q3X8Y4_MOLML